MSDSPKTFGDSSAVTSATTALMPHMVAASSQPRLSPSHPLSAWECAEVVDFILPTSASDAIGAIPNTTFGISRSEYSDLFY